MRTAAVAASPRRQPIPGNERNQGSLLGSVMECLRDPANVQQTSSKCIQNTRANSGHLLARLNTL